METVKVKKADLLEKLRGNRRQHRKIFEEATTAFRKEVISHLDAHLADARAGRRIQLSVDLIQPMDQTEEYDDAIAMCEMSVEDEMHLTQDAFRNYVLDKWHWRRDFLHSNRAYSATAAGMEA